MGDKTSQVCMKDCTFKLYKDGEYLGDVQSIAELPFTQEAENPGPVKKLTNAMEFSVTFKPTWRLRLYFKWLLFSRKIEKIMTRLCFKKGK